MNDIENIAIDFGQGATKTFRRNRGFQIISQVSAKNGSLVGQMAGIPNSQLPMEITLTPSSQSFFADKNAHDFGQYMEDLSNDRLVNGSPQTRVLTYAAITRLIQQMGEFSGPISITCGLPIETLSLECVHETVATMQKWLVRDHVWQCKDKHYQVSVADIKVTSQPAGALFDYTLDQEGRVIPEHSRALEKEVGIISIGLNTLELLTVRGKNLVQKFTNGSTSGVRRLLQLVNPNSLYSLGELDMLLRSKKLEVSSVLPVWEREIIGEIEKRWGTSWKRFETVVLVGGGIILLKNSLPFYFSGRTVIPDDPVMSISRGLYKLGLYQKSSNRG